MAEDISTLVMKVKSEGIKQGATDLDKLTKSAEKAETAVKKLGTSIITLNSQTASGTATAAAMIQAMEKLTASLVILSSQQTRAERTTRAHNESMREAHALARGLSGSFGALWLTYGNFAGMAVGVALGASLKAIVTVGKDVEHTLEKIRVLGDSSMSEVNNLREAIYDLGSGVQGPKDVAEALSVLTMAGLSATDALKGVGASLNLAIAGDVSIEKSASTLVQVGTALGYTADSFDHIADVIAKTAAVSMSSVDSIAGAFKSAAAVGEVYGASLQDIGLGLATVANLGIQGTAAGTALKNFYKDLASGSEKVVQTFKAMKMSGDEIKDLDGNFLPLIDVIRKLDEGFERLKPGDRQKAMDKIFGERGIKEGAALVKMLHTVSEEVDAEGNRYANKLEEVNDRVNKSYAFSTKAAIAMSMTTQNQMKSVANTLQTTFAKAFTDIQPQINAVSRELKDAFSSPEFIAGIKAVATAVADTTRFLVEHIKQIGIAAAAYAGWKVVQFAAGLVQVATGFGAAAIGARAFAVALGPIAVGIMAMGAAWAIYNANKDKTITNKDAAKSLEEYNDGIIKAAENEAEILRMRTSGQSEAELAAKRAMQADKDASDRVIKQSEDGLKAMKAVFNKRAEEYDKDDKRAIAAALKKGARPGDKTGDKVVDNYLEDLRAVKQAEAQLTTQQKLAADASSKLYQLRKANADAADAAAKKARVKPSGDDDLNAGKVDKGAMSSAYAEAMRESENQIKAANQAFMDEEDKLNSAYRAGKIGRIQLVNQVADAEVKATGIISKALQDQLDLAQSASNKGGDAARVEGELEANEARKAQARIMVGKYTEEEIARVQQDAAKARVKMLEDQGRNEEAAHLKFTTENAIMFQRATEDALAYGDTYPELWKKVEEFTERAQAAVVSGRMKDAMAEFELLAEKTGNTIKGVQTATENSGVETMWLAASAASEQYGLQIEQLKIKQAALAEIAIGGSDEDRTKAQEALKEIASLSEKHKTMWTGVGASIGNALEKGFGRGGKALGDMVKASISFNKLSDKSAGAQIRYYGDMADAAKGFFKEGTTGYKAMEGVSKAFHAIDMAQSAIRMGRAAIEAVLNQAKGDPYTAFARMAAMAAIVGALGYAVGGGFSSNSGGRSAEEVQATQGSGGVFGDDKAKSDSIAKSLEYLESNSDVMLPLTQGMLQSLRNIEASMTGLTNLVLRTDGVRDGTNMGITTGQLNAKGSAVDGISSFGTALTKMLLPGIGGKVAGFINNLWGNVKASIVDSGINFNGRVGDLQNGKGFTQYASVDTTKKSWFGLKKDTTNRVESQGLNSELSSQFGLVFANLEETLKLAGTALGKSGNEVSAAIDNLVVNTGVSLKGLTGEALQAAINGVMSKTMDQIAEAAFPSMGAFRQVGEGYAQTVIRVASSIEQAGVAMEALGLKAVDYTQVINKQGDVAMEIARQTIAAAEGASGINEMLKGVGSTMGELVEMYKQLSEVRKQMNSVGLNGNGLNVNVVKGAGGVSELGSALKSYEENFFTDGEKAAIMLKSVTAEFNKLGLKLPANNAELRNLIETTGVGTEANSKLTGKLLVLSDAYAELTKASEDLRTEQTSALRSSVEDLKKFIETIGDFRKSLMLGSLSTLNPEQKFREAKEQYETTLAKALSGDKLAQGKVTQTASAYLEASKIVNASSAAYGDSFSQVQSDMLRLEATAGTQLTETEKQLAALNATVNGIATLNVTAEAIRLALESPSNVAAPTLPSDIVAPAPVVMPSPIIQQSTTDGGLGVQLEQINTTLTQTQATTDRKFNDLFAVVYDAQARSANKIVDGTTSAISEAEWQRRSTGKQLER